MPSKFDTVWCQAVSNYDVLQIGSDTHNLITLGPNRKKNVKSFPSHKAHRAALISVSSAVMQTPVYTARPRTRD